MKIEITKKQRAFIKKAISHFSIVYDFDLSEKEFKESYGISQEDLLNEIESLNEVLK